MNGWRHNSEGISLSAESMSHARQIKYRQAKLEWLILAHKPEDAGHGPHGQYIHVLQQLLKEFLAEKLGEIRIAWWGEQADRFDDAMTAIGGLALRHAEILRKGFATKNPSSSFVAVYPEAPESGEAHVLPIKAGIIRYQDHQLHHVDVFQADRKRGLQNESFWIESANFWRSVFQDSSQSVDLQKIEIAA